MASGLLSGQLLISRFFIGQFLIGRFRGLLRERFRFRFLRTAGQRAPAAIRSSQSSFALLGGAGGSLSGSAADVDSSGGWSACSTSSKIFCWRLEPYSARISSKV